MMCLISSQKTCIGFPAAALHNASLPPDKTWRVFIRRLTGVCCAGHTPTWLKCPMVGRAFVLDLLEFVLLHRPAAFQTHSAFKVLLQSKVSIWSSQRRQLQLT